MRMVYTVAFMLLGLVGLPSFAGNEGGNGGDIVRCQEDDSETVELLDFFESRLLPPHRVLDLGPASWGMAQKVEFLLKRIERFDPSRSHRYKEKLAEFFTPEKTRWVTGVELKDIPDSGFVPLPSTCKIQQIAIQKEPLTPWHRLYTIDRALFDRLSADHQVGLALHEVIYGEAFRLGQRNSQSVRKFTALLSSRDLEGLTQEEYKSIVAALFPPPSSVAFKSDLLEFIAQAGGPFAVDMNSKLVSANPDAPLTWSTLEPLPRWLELDANTGVLNGTSPVGASSTIRFNLAVDNGFVGAVVPATLWVVLEGKMPAVWIVDPIIIPNVVAGKPLEIDLSKLAIEPSGDKIHFSRAAGPNWLEVTGGKAISKSVPPLTGDPSWSILAITNGGVSSVPLVLKVAR